MAGERGAGRESWLGFLGILYRASAKSAARFRIISFKRKQKQKKTLDLLKQCKGLHYICMYYGKAKPIFV